MRKDKESHINTHKYVECMDISHFCTHIMSKRKSFYQIITILTIEKSLLVPQYFSPQLNPENVWFQHWSQMLNEFQQASNYNRDKEGSTAFHCIWLQKVVLYVCDLVTCSF